MIAFPTDRSSSPSRRLVISKQRAGALLFAALSGFFIFEASFYPYMDWIGPGSGFFAMWVGSLALVAFLALLILDPVPTLPTSDNQENQASARQSRREVVGTIIFLIVAALLLQPFGFILTCGLLIAALLRLYGARLWVALVSGVIAGPAIFFIFLCLHVRLPVGALGI